MEANDQWQGAQHFKSRFPTVPTRHRCAAERVPVLENLKSPLSTISPPPTPQADEFRRNQVYYYSRTHISLLREREGVFVVYEREGEIRFYEIRPSRATPHTTSGNRGSALTISLLLGPGSYIHSQQRQPVIRHQSIKLFADTTNSNITQFSYPYTATSVKRLMSCHHTSQAGYLYLRVR